MTNKPTRGGKRDGAGAPLLGDKKRVEIKTTIDQSTKAKLEEIKRDTSMSIGVIIDHLVDGFSLIK